MQNTTPLLIAHRRIQAQAEAATRMNAPGAKDFARAHRDSTRRLQRAGMRRNNDLRVF